MLALIVGDGADRGGAAGRTRVRGQRPQAAAQPGTHGGDGRYAEAVPAGDRRPAPSCSASAAAVVGVALGIGVARLLQPLLQSRSDDWFGPFEVPWLHLAGMAGFGMLSAFLAAIVPAHLASRQDVVAVLAGRRGDRAPSLKSPLLGLVLLGVGIGGVGVRRRPGRGRGVRHRRERHPGRARDDPAGADGPGADRQGVRSAPAGAPLRRPRRQPAPHPDRSRCLRGGRDGGRGGRARDRPDLRRVRRTRRRTSRRSPPASASSLPTTRTSRGRRCAACSTGSCREPP